jgi:hypothetical protein
MGNRDHDELGGVWNEVVSFSGVHKSQSLGRLDRPNYIFFSVTKHLWVLSVELASCYHSGV